MSFVANKRYYSLVMKDVAYNWIGIIIKKGAFSEKVITFWELIPKKL